MVGRNRTTLCSLFLACLAAASFLCTLWDEAAASGTWKRLGPAPRCWGPTAVFDPVRNRMLAFGGSSYDNTSSPNFDVVWSLSLTGTSSWTTLTNHGAGPSGRWSPSSIYDPIRDRLIVFGGWGGGVFGDVWALSLSGTPAWTNLSPAGPAPSPRSGHTAIYDPVRDRMLVFGGNDGNTVDFDDVWALSLTESPAWTQIAPTGTRPANRAWHTAIYDPVRDRMVVCGGYVWNVGSLGDTWSLSLSGTPAWSSLPAAAPRNSHTAIYDPVGDRMVVHGGFDDPDNPLKLSVLSFAGSPAWSQITPAGTPPPVLRDGAAGVYDAPNQRVVYYAGIDPDFANVWAVTLSGTPTWSAIAPVGTAGYRQGPIVYDSLRDRMAMLSYVFADSIHLWAQSLAGEPTWSKSVPTGAAPQFNNPFNAIYDPSRDRAVICLEGQPVEIWTLDFATLAWSQLALTGTPPTLVQHRTAIYDPVRDRMVLFGGEFFNVMSDETWAVNFTGEPSWTQLPSGPPARGLHVAIYDSDRDDMVIFGGRTSISSPLRDAWRLDLGTNTWTEIVPTAALPSDHVLMSGIYDAPRQRLLIFGGRDPDLETNKLWSLSLAGSPTWTLLAPSGLLPLPNVYKALYDPDRDRMIAYGAPSPNLYETWAFSPSVNVGVPDLHGPGSAGLALASPRPNPSREITEVEYSLARPGHVALNVFDVSGRRVRVLVSGQMPAGSHSATWSGDDEQGRPAGSGLYFVRLRCDGQEMTQRLVRVF